MKETTQVNVVCVRACVCVCACTRMYACVRGHVCVLFTSSVTAVQL